MKEIQHNKFSLFIIDKPVGEYKTIEECFEYVYTYQTLEDAQLAQKELKNKSIILASW